MQHKLGTRLWCLAAASTAVVLLHQMLRALDHKFDASSQVERSVSWDEIPAFKKLRWKNCELGFQCARLVVPLDYDEPEGRAATIALKRIPATDPPDSPDYKGPIIVNPGGPGGSGVYMIERQGKTLSMIAGPQFDIVGFDPRGVHLSTPVASFFETDAERAIFSDALAVVNNSDDGLGRTIARKTLLGKLAARQEGDYLRFINTENTARDMLKIVEAHGREKIMYWGFSFGTVIGATFATMFPDRIERLVVDGVVDSEDYYAAMWSNSLVDAETVFNLFFSSCFSAGPEGCAFYAPTEKAIRANFTKLQNHIRANPMPVVSDTTYGILDYNIFRLAVFTALYVPLGKFPTLARALAELSAGDGKTMYEMVRGPPFRCSCDDANGETPNNTDCLGEKSSRTPPKGISLGEAYNTIMCNDGDEVPHDLESTYEYFDMMTRKSQWADIWSGLRMNCVAWPKWPKSKFRGPFEANTSHPILFVGNSADPVSPLWAAKKMSRGFNGSVVLTQDTAGHCSLSTPSICTTKYVRAYFVNGTLPESGTICPGDAAPFYAMPEFQDGLEDLLFDPSPQTAFSMFINSLDREDRNLFGALWKTSKSLTSGGLPFML